MYLVLWPNDELRLFCTILASWFIYTRTGSRLVEICILAGFCGRPFFSRESRPSKLFEIAHCCVLLVMDSYMAESCAGTAGRLLITSFMMSKLLTHPNCLVCYRALWAC